MFKKFSITIALLSTIAVAGFAQNVTSSISQTIRLELAAAIEITSVNASTINMKFENATQYMNGIQSGSQQFKVRSNKDFIVSVNTDAAYFTYSGPSSNNRSMPVNNILFMEVYDNNTGGNTVEEFTNYNSLTNTPKNLIVNGASGGDQTFAVNYKARPDMNYAAGQYMVGVVYTATQP